MKLTQSLIIISLAVCSNTFSQIAPPPPTDSASIEYMYYDSTAVESVGDYYENQAAYPVEGDYQMPSFNVFKNNSKIKPEEKPDKKASYSMGNGELLIEISRQLMVPFNYNDDNKYVIIQFVVGKDSMLYNPQVLYTPGAEYSINATKVIESLQEKFVPASKNGKPVDSIIIIPIRFVKHAASYYEKG
jgi:hypothetical protein